MLSWFMDFVSFVGFAAGALCTLAYLPQALHSFRTKSVSDISLAMLVSLNLHYSRGYWPKSPLFEGK